MTIKFSYDTLLNRKNILAKDKERGFNKMNKLKNKIKNMKGITLISLVITIIVLIILAGFTLNLLLRENGIINKSKTAKNENEKATATETMNLKITNVQISKYAEEQRMPTLKELAYNFCEDDDFQYVQETIEVASLTKITNNNPTSIYTKLKAYPYEFEINSSLQLASIDGVKVATIPENDNDSIISMTKSDLDNYINAAIQSKLASELEYKPGDTITYPNKINISGFVTSGSKGLRGTLFLDKKISQNVSSITFSTGNFEIRAENKYLITGSASSSSTNYNFATYFTASHRKGSNAIYFYYDAETSFNITNNSPISIALENLTITFN